MFCDHWWDLHLEKTQIVTCIYGVDGYDNIWVHRLIYIPLDSHPFGRNTKTSQNTNNYGLCGLIAGLTMDGKPTRSIFKRWNLVTS